MSELETWRCLICYLIGNLALSNTECSDWLLGFLCYNAFKKKGVSLNKSYNSLIILSSAAGNFVLDFYAKNGKFY